MCPGRILITNEVIQDIANKLEYKSTKSVHSNLKKLYTDGWLTLNKNNGQTFVKGFELIRKEKYFDRRSAVVLTLEDLNHLSQFAAAAVITSLINSQKARYIDLAANKYATNKKVATKLNRRRVFFPISTHILAKILKCSVTHASRLRREAVKLGYLEMKKSKPIATGVPVQEYAHFIKTEPGKQILIKDNQIFIRDADQVKTNIKLRSRISIIEYQDKKDRDVKRKRKIFDGAPF